jgi:hypothetical protein
MSNKKVERTKTKKVGEKGNDDRFSEERPADAKE